MPKNAPAQSELREKAGAMPLGSGFTPIAILPAGVAEDAVSALVNLGSGVVSWVLSGDGRTLTMSVGGQPALLLQISGPTSIAAGATDEVTITATLIDNVVHVLPPSTLNVILSGVSVVATDVSGDQVSGTVSVNIVDDVPTAVADGPVGVVEDGLGSLSGNVLSNDVSGAKQHTHLIGGQRAAEPEGAILHPFDLSIG